MLPLVVMFVAGVFAVSGIVDQTKAGCAAMTAPNWSNPWATIAWLVPVTFSTAGYVTTCPLGATRRSPLITAVTATVFTLLTERPVVLSRIVTVNEYDPTSLNVTIVFLEALAPLELKVATPPAGEDVTVHL